MAEYSTVKGERVKTSDEMLDDRLKLMAEIVLLKLALATAEDERDRARKDLMDVVEGRIR